MKRHNLSPAGTSPRVSSPPVRINPRLLTASYMLVDAFFAQPPVEALKHDGFHIHLVGWTPFSSTNA